MEKQNGEERTEPLEFVPKEYDPVKLYNELFSMPIADFRKSLKREVEVIASQYPPARREDVRRECDEFLSKGVENEIALRTQIDSATKKIEQNPLDFEQYLSRATLWNKAHASEAALKDLLWIVEKSKDTPRVEVFIEMARAYLDIRYIKQARKTAIRALAHAPNNVDAVMQRGRCESTVVQEEMKYFKKAITIKPNPILPYCLSGLAWCYVKKKDFATATKKLEEALKIDKFLPRAYFLSGYMNHNRYFRKECIRGFSISLLLDPRDFGCIGNRGNAFNDFGMNPFAIADYERAIKIHCKDYFAYYNLGLLYLESGKYLKAISSFSGAIRAFPDDHRSFHDRGLLYWKMGQYSLAIDDFVSSVGKIKLSDELGPGEKEKEEEEMRNELFDLCQECVFEVSGELEFRKRMEDEKEREEEENSLKDKVSWRYVYSMVGNESVKKKKKNEKRIMKMNKATRIYRRTRKVPNTYRENLKKMTLEEIYATRAKACRRLHRNSQAARDESYLIDRRDLGERMDWIVKNLEMSVCVVKLKGSRKIEAILVLIDQE